MTSIIATKDVPAEDQALRDENVRLRNALARFEAAADALAGARTQKAYLAMIDEGQQPLLEEMGAARKEARALLSGQPGAEVADPGEAIRERVRDALYAELRLSYDCSRVWEAWSYKTMTADDFSEISENSERIDGICEAVIAAVFLKSGEPFAAPADLLAEVSRARAESAAAQNDAIKFYLRCDRAALHFQAGNPAEAEREIMGRPNEGRLVGKIAQAIADLPADEMKTA